MGPLIKIMKSFSVTYYFCSFLECVCGLIECKYYTENHVYCQIMTSLVMLVKFHHDKKYILITKRVNVNIFFKFSCGHKSFFKSLQKF
jgi:hypothetical protein